MLMLAGQGFAQDQEKINTGRPDQTQGTYTVQPKLLQLETGLRWQYDRQGEEKVRNHAYPEVTLRTGVLPWLELRVDAAWQDTVRENNGGRSVAHGIGPVRVGTRVRLWNAKGLLPAAAVQATVTLPIGSRDLRPDRPETELILALSHELSQKVQLMYNLGYTWLEENPEKSYTVSLGAELSDKVSVYGEVFGSKPTGGKAEHQADAGLLYLLRPNMQLDVAAGVGLNEAAPDYFILTGFSFRLPR